MLRLYFPKGCPWIVAESVYITGIGSLSPCGLTPEDLLAGMGRSPAFGTTALVGKKNEQVSFGSLPDFSDLLAEYAKPLKRRKMSRLSRMVVTVAGLALTRAGFDGKSFANTGVVLGTAFGSTHQSELFYLDMLTKGFVKANPGLFPETVPNSPAGQVSIIFGLKGANITICQQSLSSDLALMTGFDFLCNGKLDQVVIIGAEDISTGLLSGLWACGSLQKKPLSLHSVPLGKKMIVGEAAVALVLESEKSVCRRNASPLAVLASVYSSGAARWPAGYHEVAESVRREVTRVDPSQVDCVIPSASFIKQVDDDHFSTLAKFFDAKTPMLIPEYHTGALLGAGLLKQVLAVSLLREKQFQARKLGIMTNNRYDELYKDTFSRVSSIYSSTVTAGGGCSGVLIKRVN